MKIIAVVNEFEGWMLVASAFGIVLFFIYIFLLIFFYLLWKKRGHKPNNHTDSRHKIIIYGLRGTKISAPLVMVANNNNEPELGDEEIPNALAWMI